MKTSGISIIVVDDYQPWRNYVCATLPQWLDSPVITEACDGLEAVNKARELQPDLILLDVGLPGLNGLETAGCIRETSARSKILFVSEDRSPEIAEEGLRTGARGYITKSSAASELWPAIQAVLRGEVFLGQGLSILSGDSAQSSPVPATLLEEVTESAQQQTASSMSEDNLPPLSRLARFLRNVFDERFPWPRQ